MRTIDFYALKKGGHPFPTDILSSSELNADGHDIYWTVNEFFPHHNRKKENLVKIWSMYCESDNVSEKEMHDIFKHHLPPSVVIRTKRGFHIYYDLVAPIDTIEDPIVWADWYHAWVMTRLVPVFKADPQASDACRLLRPAFYKYWKDGLGTFKTDIVVDNQPSNYTVAILEKFFPAIEQRPVKKTQQTEKQDGDFWTRANLLPAEESLERLSGTEHVCFESYKIRHVGGRTRVDCNGKHANVWIDEGGKIGSADGGGPSIPNWLYWYHKDWKRVAAILKTVWPELEKK